MDKSVHLVTQKFQFFQYSKSPWNDLSFRENFTFQSMSVRIGQAITTDFASRPGTTWTPNPGLMVPATDTNSSFVVRWGCPDYRRFRNDDIPRFQISCGNETSSLVRCFSHFPCLTDRLVPLPVALLVLFVTVILEFTITASHLRRFWTNFTFSFFLQRISFAFKNPNLHSTINI